MKRQADAKPSLRGLGGAGGANGLMPPGMLPPNMDEMMQGLMKGMVGAGGEGAAGEGAAGGLLGGLLGGLGGGLGGAAGADGADGAGGLEALLKSPLLAGAAGGLGGKGGSRALGALRTALTLYRKVSQVWAALKPWVPLVFWLSVLTAFFGSTLPHFFPDFWPAIARILASLGLGGLGGLLHGIGGSARVEAPPTSSVESGPAPIW